MPIAQLRGVNINYEVLGSAGPWVALSPGGRRALDNVKSLAQPPLANCARQRSMAAMNVFASIAMSAARFCGRASMRSLK